MNKNELLYWLHRWDDEGIFDIDFDGLEEDGLLDEFVKMGIRNPFHFMFVLNSILSN